MLVVPTLDDNMSGLLTFEEEGGLEESTTVGVDLSLGLPMVEEKMLGLPTLCDKDMSGLPTLEEELLGLPTLEEEGEVSISVDVGSSFAWIAFEGLLEVLTRLSTIFPDLRVVIEFTGLMFSSSQKCTPRELYLGFISVWLGNLPFSLFKFKIFITSAN